MSILQEQRKVRVRYAPSPTGPQHIGGIRTAVYNYFFAKRMGGTFILRIEDTDEKRFVEGSEAYLKEALSWMSITPDEGPDQGGAYGPYRQSERKHLYKKYAEELVRRGYAYYAFDTTDELALMRERQMSIGVHTASYNAITRMSMKNSLTLSAEEVECRVVSDSYVVRLHVDPQRTIRFHDEVRGWVQVQGSVLDDKVLLKKTGMPTYHLANVVDDHLMEISHVIRGEEWLPSTPIHCLIYEGLGWQMPILTHLPLLLRADGKGKLSKRAVEVSGVPIFPLDWYDVVQARTYAGFREKGYLPEAILNFIALLGWNPGHNQEVMTVEELCRSFSLKRINKAGVQVDVDKATWFNQCHLRRLSGRELANRYLLPILCRESLVVDEDYVAKVCDVVKKRISFPSELWSDHPYFFIPPKVYDWESIAEGWTGDVLVLFDAICEGLAGLEVFDEKGVKDLIKEKAGFYHVGLSVIMPFIRMAITGVLVGPELMDIIVCLGRSSVVERLSDARTRWNLR